MDANIEKICKEILDAFDDNSVLRQSNFSIYLQEYIFNKYKNVIDSFEKEKNKREMDTIVQMYIEDEIHFFENLPDNEIKIILLPDKALKELEEASFQIFELAMDCKRRSYKLNNNSEYEEWLLKLSAPLDNIKKHNIPYAQELLSEGILDVEYAYGKTDNMSLRLAKVV